jgi:hypothetical protein
MRGLRAEIRLHSDDIPRSRLARATVLFAYPDRYLVKFRALFGTTVAVLAVRKQDVNLYLPMSNRLYEGHLTAAQVGELLGIELAPADLMEAMLGTVSLPPVSQLLEYHATSEGHVLIFSWQGGRQEVQVAPDGVRVRRVVFREPSGEAVMTKVFEDYHLVDDVVRPGQLRASLPGKGSELEVIYTREDINPSYHEGDFRPRYPDSVERVQLYPE